MSTRLLDCIVDETPWPGPDYSPTVWMHGFHIGNQARPGDLYCNVFARWYRYELTDHGWDWVRLPGRPEEADW